MSAEYSKYDLRRAFLVLGSAAIAAVAASGCSPFGSEGETGLPDIDRLAKFVASEFGFSNVHLGYIPESSRSLRTERGMETNSTEQFPDQQSMQQALRTLVEGMSLYSPEFIDLIRERNVTISLCYSFKTGINGVSNPSSANSITSETDSIMMIDASVDFLLRWALDHELFHAVLERMTNINEVANLVETFTEIDTTHGLSGYSPDLVTNCSLSQSTITPGHAGCYSYLNPHEEAAEIARQLFSGDWNLWDRINPGNDEVLALKVAHVVKIYEKATNGKMDLAYFERISLGKENDPWGYGLVG